MNITFDKVIKGYKKFRAKYAEGDQTLMRDLAKHGQSPEIMVISCSDSRVDPAILLQCDPGDLFVVRNIANIVPPYENDEKHHGTSAALEFGVCYLNIKNIIILGHSSCAGINAKLKSFKLGKNDFISNWINQISVNQDLENLSPDEYARQSLIWSYQNCLTFPWIKERLDSRDLQIHLWFLDIHKALIEQYNFNSKNFESLSV